MACFSVQIEGLEIAGSEPDVGSTLSSVLSCLKNQISKLPLLHQIRYALYRIRVVHAGKYYIIKKRFSEFAALHRRLESVLELEDVALPPKTHFRELSEHHLENRKDALNAYLEKICGSLALAANEDLMLFLRPSTNRPTGFLVYRAMQRASRDRQRELRRKRASREC